MNIAIIGTGNVGGALATKWAAKGHLIHLGVRDQSHFKGMELLNNPNTTVHSIEEAVQMSDVVLLSTPAPMAVDVAKSLGDTTGKIIIDAMNIVGGNDRFELMEQFAWFWINLAMVQGLGREIGFKLVKR